MKIGFIAKFTAVQDIYTHKPKHKDNMGRYKRIVLVPYQKLRIKMQRCNGIGSANLKRDLKKAKNMTSSKFLYNGGNR